MSPWLRGSANVKGDGCGVLSPSVGLISKLMVVEGWWELVGPVFASDQTSALGNDRGECNWKLVSEAGWDFFFFWGGGGLLQTGRVGSLNRRQFVIFCKDLGKLVDADI